MSKKEWAVWILIVALVLVVILNSLFGCSDPRQEWHNPGTYDCCVKAWQETDKD